MKTIAIVWFKTDLRLHDNETLVRALEQNDEIICAYCFDENHFKTTTFGFEKTGKFRAQFLIEALQDLDKYLRDLGSGLIIVKGKPEIEIIRLVKKYNAKKVFAKQEIAFEELHTQKMVESELHKIGSTLETNCTSTLYRVDDLSFSLQDMPDIFTNFRKLTECKSQIREPFETPTKIFSPQIEPVNLPTFEELGLPTFEVDKRAAILFKGGEAEALKRLNYYLFETKAISTYKETRNGLVGEKYSSKFSAWLSMGCLSARKIYQEIKKYEQQFGSNESTYWLVFELMWRDYFYFTMQKYKHKFFLKNGIKNSNTKLFNHDIRTFEKWKNGTTGNDFVDANMLELKLTGFMSNRGRQNVASFLIHDLNLDWRYGAAYFEQQLIDYDVCINWCNWAYIAGVGNDPRSNRIFNTEKQANDYDGKFEFRNLWLNN